MSKSQRTSKGDEMIEKRILDYLNSALSVPCYMEEPTKRPKSYCLLELTSGTESYGVNNATFVIQSYGESLYKAAQLDREVIKVMLDFPRLEDTINKTTLNSHYNYTDTETKRYRYQAVFDIYYY